MLNLGIEASRAVRELVTVMAADPRIPRESNVATTSIEPTIAQQPRAPSQSRLPHLDAMRGLGIVLVVGMHAHGYSGVVLPGPAEHLWSRVAGVSVPLFFLADGFLFASAASRGKVGSWSAFMRKSSARLLTPYLVWTLFDVLMRAVFEWGGLLPNRLVVGRSFPELLKNVFHSRVAMQMYFLPSLYLVRGTAFAAWTLARRSGLVSLAAGVGAIVLLQAWGPTLGEDPLTNALFGLPYYWLGFAAQRLDGVLRRHAPAIAGAALLAFVGLFVLEDLRIVPRSAGALVQLALIAGEYAAFLALASSPGTLTWLGRRTMEVYLIHAPVLLKSVQVILSRIVAAPLAVWPLLWLTTFGVSLLLARWLSVNALVRRVAFGTDRP